MLEFVWIGWLVDWWFLNDLLKLFNIAFSKSNNFMTYLNREKNKTKKKRKIEMQKSRERNWKFCSNSSSTKFKQFPILNFLRSFNLTYCLFFFHFFVRGSVCNRTEHCLRRNSILFYFILLVSQVQIKFAFAPIKIRTGRNKKSFYILQLNFSFHLISLLLHHE